jgi:hypothetical protein
MTPDARAGKQLVLFEVSFEQAGRSRQAMATQEFTLDTPELTDHFADVQVKTSLTALNEKRPGRVYLVVTNRSDVPFTLRAITPGGPTFAKEPPGADPQRLITFTPATFSNQQPLLPGGVQTVDFQVNATGDVQPGQHLLIFDIEVERAGQIRHVVTTYQVSVGVFAESEILGLLAVPSFIVLPGFLMIVTAGLLWQIGFLKSPDETQDFPLQINSANFWLVALTLSGLMYYVYRAITDRDYLAGYGLSDIVQVWMISVFFIGCGIYILGMLLFNRYRKDRVPSSNDEPIIALKKLGRLRLGIVRDRIDIDINGRKEHVFLLESIEKLQGEAWVAPAVVVNWGDNPDQIVQSKIEDELALGSRASATRIAELLEMGEASGITADWRPIGWLVSPRKVPVTKPLQSTQRSVIIGIG